MRKLSLIDKIIFVLNIIGATLLLLSYILPYLPPKAFFVFSVLSLGVSVLMIINVLFFMYWLFKLKKQLILSLVILLIGYITYGSLYKFSSSKNIGHVNNIKVMNYNVRLFNLYEWIPEDNIDIKILDFIKKESPDILNIQDYHPNPDVDFSFFKYKYEKLSGKKLKSGQVIFSQYPIIHSGSLEFPNTANNAIFADVVKGKDTIRIYNIHLQSLKIDTNVEKLKQENTSHLFNRVGSTFRMQQSQTELFLAHKEKCKYKMIISGDFNNTAYSYVYRCIKGDLNDTFIEAGNGFGRTYDFRFFPVRIDFMFADDAFAVNGFKTYNEHYSDHYPIMTKLSLED
ncbi:endonuclease/exonuclease/phosphatase family protein [Confluentibacter flavum]|uniref:Endonuclease n=1 Tax=Confluentibacter flavum TaxID=1909700 RepID=A0A2N3HIM1_9FLAO|nr:endonuclease/exonuclease/phosphatase family protein [Confluentibacter flavum]PKQ44753.1 endonuclease [Confluentibacter flavum]